MKLITVALSVLSAAFTVYARLDPKKLSIGCNSESQAKACKESVEKVLAKAYDTPDIFTSVNFAFGDSRGAEAIFTGSCDKSNEVLRSLPGCGMQECPNVICSPLFKSSGDGILSVGELLKGLE